jgi:hypothetical protein
VPAIFSTVVHHLIPDEQSYMSRLGKIISKVVDTLRGRNPPSTHYLLRHQRIRSYQPINGAELQFAACDDSKVLNQLSEALLNAESSDFGVMLLPSPNRKFVLQFECGTEREVGIGQSGKLTSALAVEIDGRAYIVKAGGPGLPNFPLSLPQRRGD